MARSRETAVERVALKACIEVCEETAAMLLEDAPTLMDVLLKCETDQPAAAATTEGQAAAAAGAADGSEPAFPCRAMDSMWCVRS